MDLTLVGQGLLSGFLFGGVYSLMAVGLTLIFGVMRVVNFAHGDMMVWGMYLAWLLSARAGIDPYVGFLACAAALFLFGLFKTASNKRLIELRLRHFRFALLNFPETGLDRAGLGNCLAQLFTPRDLDEAQTRESVAQHFKI